MVEVMKADTSHVTGIAQVCAAGWRSTYANIHSQVYIEEVIEAYYNVDRILSEVTHSDANWTGYYVAVDNGKVVGAAGGGMLDRTTGELFVLYLDPNRRGQGIGSQLLEAVTQALRNMGAKQQWVSVAKANQLGIPFYEARGFIYQYPKPDNSEVLRYLRKL